MTRLGLTHLNGSVRFKSGDINECRTFLREAGLECEHRGWEGAGRLGAIYFDCDGLWEAAWWPYDNK